MNNLTISNYQKQFVSLTAAFEIQPIIPEFFKSLQLMPEEDNWLIWIDGHGNKLEINSKSKKIESKSGGQHLIFDPYFYTPYSEVSVRFKKTLWSLTTENNLILFSLDTENKFRTIIFNPESIHHVSPLLFGYQTSLEIFSFLILPESPPSNWKFSSQFGEQEKYFWDLTSAPEMLKLFPSITYGELHS